MLAFWAAAFANGNHLRRDHPAGGVEHPDRPITFGFFDHHAGQTSLTGHHPVLNVFLMGVGVAWSLININSLPMVVDLTTLARVGTFTGLYFLFSTLAAIVGPNLYGWIVQLNGGDYNTMFFASPVFLIVALVLMLGVHRGGRQQLIYLRRPGLELKNCDDLELPFGNADNGRNDHFRLKAIFPARSKPDGLNIGQVKDSGQIKHHVKSVTGPGLKQNISSSCELPQEIVYYIHQCRIDWRTPFYTGLHSPGFGKRGWWDLATLSSGVYRRESMLVIATGPAVMWDQNASSG